MKQLASNTWFELRCKCGKLIGFLKQKYYMKHEYLCVECYMSQIREGSNTI